MQDVCRKPFRTEKQRSPAVSSRGSSSASAAARAAVRSKDARGRWPRSCAGLRMTLIGLKSEVIIGKAEGGYWMVILHPNAIPKMLVTQVSRSHAPSTPVKLLLDVDRRVPSSTAPVATRGTSLHVVWIWQSSTTVTMADGSAHIFEHRPLQSSVAHDSFRSVVEAAPTMRSWTGWTGWAGWTGRNPARATQSQG